MKPSVRASDREVEAWLDLNGSRFWVGRGRPPTGQKALIAAVGERFQVTRQTVIRMVKRIAQRRTKALRALPVDPAQAHLLAALAGRYQNNVSLTAGVNVPAQINGSQVPSGKDVMTRGAQVKSATIPPAIALADLRGIVLRAVSDWPDASLAQELLTLCDKHRPPAAGGPAPGVKGLDAIGLREIKPNSLQTKRIQDLASMTREALIESLEAYEAMVPEPANVTRAIKSLRDYLVQRAQSPGG